MKQSVGKWWKALGRDFFTKFQQKAEYQEAISTSLSNIQASVNLLDVKIQLLLTRIGDVLKEKMIWYR
jgi:hypothetical protein